MQLIPLENESQLSEILSGNERMAILKHNTTCSISNGVLQRLEQEEREVAGLPAIYVVDLLANRDLSNTIAGRFGVPHQSPQVLLIQNGRCIYHEWGFDISASALSGAAGRG